MTALDLARTAYDMPGTPARTLRGIEYAILARVTRALKAASEENTRDFPALAAALHDNRRLWSTLAADVASPDNALPAPLRARLFYLYQFVDQHSRKMLSGVGKVDVLIDINTAIMRGLRGDGGPT